MSKPFTLAQLPDFRAGLNPLASDMVELADNFSGGSKPVYLEEGSAFAAYFHHYRYEEYLTQQDVEFDIGTVSCLDWQLAVQVWRQPSAKACVFVAHGLFDHVAIYLKLINALLARNFNVVAIDMPGHGLSTGNEACIDDFNDYSKVLQAVIGMLKTKILFGPYYAVGQSTGGAAVMRYLYDSKCEKRELDKVVLLAPLVQPRAYWSVAIAHSMLSHFVAKIPRSYSINSHDKIFSEFLLHGDPLQPKSISVKWVGAMRRWVKDFEKFASNDTPMLVIQGDKDGTVDWERNIPRIARQFVNSKVIMVEGAMHHLVNEGDRWREKVFSDMLDFLEAP